MISRLKKNYRRQRFNPNLLGIFTNPFYFARKELYQKIRELSIGLKGSLLDIGCGTKPYQSLFDVDQYIGLEVDDGSQRNNSFADALYDGKIIPFPDKRFNVILTNQVFEHVFDPALFLEEINRVCKMNGHLLLTAPFVWDEHEQPFDFARYSSFGLKHMLEKHGFKLLEHHKTNTGFISILQLLNGYIFKVTLSKFRLLNWLSMLFVMAPINLFGFLLQKVFPKNPDIYLDNVILAKKIANV